MGGRRDNPWIVRSRIRIRIRQRGTRTQHQHPAQYRSRSGCLQSGDEASPRPARHIHPSGHFLEAVSHGTQASYLFRASGGP